MPRKKQSTDLQFRVIFAIGFDGVPVLVDAPFSALTSLFRINENDYEELRNRHAIGWLKEAPTGKELCGDSSEIMKQCTNLPDKPGLYSAIATAGTQVKLSQVRRFSKLYRQMLNSAKFNRPN